MTAASNAAAVMLARFLPELELRLGHADDLDFYN